MDLALKNLQRWICHKTQTTYQLTDSEVRVMLEIWGVRSTTSLPSLPVSLGPGVVALDRVLSMGQIDLNCVFMLNCIT